MKYMLAAIFLLVTLHSADAQTLMADIQKSNNAFAKAFNAGNATAVGQFYTSDATAMPPGADLLKGRAAITAFWQAQIKAGVKNVVLTTVSVEGFGHTASEIGRVVLDAPGPDGQPAKVEGKYLVIWKNVEGKWLLDTDIWNLSK